MGEKKKFDNRIIIGIAVAAAIVGVVIYAVFGGKGDKENGLSSLYSEPAQSVVSAEQSEISEQISEQPLEQSQVESEAIMSQPDAAQTTIPQTTKPQNNGQDGQYSNTYPALENMRLWRHSRPLPIPSRASSITILSMPRTKMPLTNISPNARSLLYMIRA